MMKNSYVEVHKQSVELESPEPQRQEDDSIIEPAGIIPPFDENHLLITNYNLAMTATSGSGKSFFHQSMLLQGE